jgi:hypothetical protein
MIRYPFSLDWRWSFFDSSRAHDLQLPAMDYGLLFRVMPLSFSFVRLLCSGVLQHHTPSPYWVTCSFGKGLVGGYLTALGVWEACSTEFHHYGRNGHGAARTRSGRKVGTTKSMSCVFSSRFTFDFLFGEPPLHRRAGNWLGELGWFAFGT